MPVLLRTIAVLLAVFSGTLLLADERLEALEEQAFREAAALAEPSIVRIETVGGLDVVNGLLTPSGPTTGVIVGEDGWIITSSFNFASKPASVLVTTPDGERHAAVPTASDESRMLTLLKIDATGLNPIEPAGRDNLRVGQWAIALGRTFDQPFPNISVGIVSALGRIWDRAVQTDAKTSPTNYGGPLVDISGHAIGIIVPLDPQKSDETAGVEWYDSGIGFAVPMQDVYAVLPRLQAGEDLKTGRMGIVFTELGPTAGEPIVERVRPGSPAYDAGLRPGDRLVQVDGRSVRRVADVRHILGPKYADDQVAITYSREGSEATTRMILAATLEPYQAPMLGILPRRPGGEPDQDDGVPVRFVFPGSPAAQAGVQRQDAITHAGGEQVINAEELRARVRQFDPGDSLTLSVRNDSAVREVTVTLAGMTADTPDELPSPATPARQEEPEAARTGRFVDTLGGDEQRSYWAYVPTDYRAANPCGLAVWLHPAGDTHEAEILKAWQTECDRRGILLVGPKAPKEEGWTSSEIDFVSDLIEDFRERYAIDPLRIVLHAYGDAAPMAAATAFREQETIRGISFVGASLAAPPPESHPEFPLQFHFACGEEDSVLEDVRNSAQALRKLKYPVSVLTIPGLGHAFPASTSIEAIARWIDTLDRI